MGFSFINANIVYKGICEKYDLIDINGYKYHCRLQHLLNNKLPNFVGINNPYSCENIKLWIKKNNKPFELISETFENAHTYLKFKCSCCNTVFERNWNNIYSGGNGCRKCRYENQKILQMRPRSMSKEMLFDYPEICEDWNAKNKYSYEKYSAKSGFKVKWKCHMCGYEWETSIAHRVKDKSGCPKCSFKMSKGENIIYNYLQNKNIPFVKEAIFKDCRDINPLPFDFYLPDYNICIEYDGEQHFKPVSFGCNKSAEEKNRRFLLTQKHDKIKNEYCTLKNIKLIRISYLFKEHISTILDKEFLHNKI